MVPCFFYHPRMMAYSFGPNHPLKPERLRRTIVLLREVADVEMLDPGLAEPEAILAVHSGEYVEAVRELSAQPEASSGLPFGFGSADNPPFPGMYEASLAYCGGGVAAADRLVEGERLAFNIAGGLHHAQRALASGFCIFNDPAVAISRLRSRFERIAYVDIDVHHGDGVQALFYDDPHVLTCSIHESGAYFYPGTGHVEEMGKAFTSVNVPLPPGTGGDVWLWAFRMGVLPALRQFAPEAIVLQMGTDAHFDDPLAHLRVTAQDWLEAVREIAELGLPTLACGGGGYNLTTVPRMWVAAILTLAGHKVPSQIPESLAAELGVSSFFDLNSPGSDGEGRTEAEAVIRRLEGLVLRHIPGPPVATYPDGSEGA